MELDLPAQRMAGVEGVAVRWSTPFGGLNQRFRWWVPTIGRGELKRPTYKPNPRTVLEENYNPRMDTLFIEKDGKLGHLVRWKRVNGGGGSRGTYAWDIFWVAEEALTPIEGMGLVELIKESGGTGEMVFFATPFPGMGTLEEYTPARGRVRSRPLRLRTDDAPVAAPPPPDAVEALQKADLERLKNAQLLIETRSQRRLAEQYLAALAGPVLTPIPEPYDVPLGAVIIGAIRRPAKGKLVLTVVFPRPDDRMTIYVRARPEGVPGGIPGTGWFAADGEDRWIVPEGWASQSQQMEVIFAGAGSTWWTLWTVQVDGPFVDPDLGSARNINFTLATARQLTPADFRRLMDQIGFEAGNPRYLELSSVNTLAQAKPPEPGYVRVTINSPLSLLVTPGGAVVVSIDGKEFRGKLLSVSRDSSQVELEVRADEIGEPTKDVPPARTGGRKIDTED